MIARIWMAGMTYPGHTKLLLQRDVSVKNVSSCQLNLPSEDVCSNHPNFRGVRRSRQFIESNPHPFSSFSTWHIVFSWSHEVRSKKHQADVTKTRATDMVWLVGPSRHGRVLAAVLRQVAVGSGSAKLLEVRFFGNGAAVESLHRLRFSLKIYGGNEWNMTTYASKFTNIAANQFSGWGFNQTHGFSAGWTGTMQGLEPRNDFWVPTKPGGEDRYEKTVYIIHTVCNENFDIWSVLFYLWTIAVVFFF